MKKQKGTSPPEASPARRNFLTMVWIGLGFVVLAEFFWIIISFLKPRRSRAKGESGEIVVIGAVDDFEKNSVTAFTRGRFYISRLDDGGFIAMSCKCTHLGCTVTWDIEKKRFECPCHASAFDIKGNVINPPAPRALDFFPIMIENNIVKIDTGKRIQRKRFAETQVALPAIKI